MDAIRDEREVECERSGNGGADEIGRGGEGYGGGDRGGEGMGVRMEGG